MTEVQLLSARRELLSRQQLNMKLSGGCAGAQEVERGDLLSLSLLEVGGTSEEGFRSLGFE